MVAIALVGCAPMPLLDAGYVGGEEHVPLRRARICRDGGAVDQGPWLARSTRMGGSGTMHHQYGFAQRDAGGTTCELAGVASPTGQFPDAVAVLPWIARVRGVSFRHASS